MHCLFLLAAADGSPPDLSIFNPVSPGGRSIALLAILAFAITGLIFLLVEGILFYSIFRFRRRGPDDGKEPAQVYGSRSIEVAWTAAPAMIVVILVLVTARSLWVVNHQPPEPRPGDQALFVTVVGRQWWWEYRYDHHDGKPLGFITANELHVPASADGSPRPVYLTLLSADVAHSYWVPRLMGKIDLIPGKTNHLSFQTEKPGLYLGQCAEYCGTQHAHMLLRVYVDEPADFDHWLADQQKPAPTRPGLDEARSLFLRQSCVNCHRIRGTTARGVYAPDLTHLMSRATLAGGMIPNTPENLQAWVKDPQQIKVGCLMPAFGLAPRQLDLVVRYLQSLE